MKKRMKLLTSLLLCCTLLAGCAGATAEESTESAGESSSTEAVVEESEASEDASGIDYAGRNKLAMFAPLTGDNMQYGEKIRDGAELAVNQFNEANGTSFTIEFHDDKGDPNEAVNLANKIVSDDTVVAALAGYGSTCAMATASVFDENGMMLIGVAASHADLPGMGEYVYPIPMSQRLEAVEFANAVTELCGASDIAILYQNTEQGVQASNLFKGQWEENGGSVSIYESFVPGETKDFSAVLSKIKEAAPDVFYVSASYSDAAQIFLQAKQLELDAQYVGPGMCVNEEFLNLVGTELDGTYILSSTPCFLPSVLEAGNIDETTQKFIDDYKAAYGSTPDGFSAQGYDAVNIVLSSALAAGSTDTAAVAAEINEIRSYPGLSGFDMCYNDQKEMNKGIYVFQLKDGSFERIR